MDRKRKIMVSRRERDVIRFCKDLDLLKSVPGSLLFSFKNHFIRRLNYTKCYLIYKLHQFGFPMPGLLIEEHVNLDLMDSSDLVVYVEKVTETVNSYNHVSFP